MLSSCIDIFQTMAGDNVDQFILDNYVPANGTYLIYEETMDGFVEKSSYEVQTDKKTGTVQLSDHERIELARLDYPSQLIDLNKALGQKNNSFK